MRTTITVMAAIPRTIPADIPTKGSCPGLTIITRVIRTDDLHHLDAILATTIFEIILILRIHTTQNIPIDALAIIMTIVTVASIMNNRNGITEC